MLQWILAFGSSFLFMLAFTIAEDYLFWGLCIREDHFFSKQWLVSVCTTNRPGAHSCAKNWKWNYAEIEVCKCTMKMKTSVEKAVSLGVNSSSFTFVFGAEQCHLWLTPAGVRVVRCSVTFIHESFVRLSCCSWHVSLRPLPLVAVVVWRRLVFHLVLGVLSRGEDGWMWHQWFAKVKVFEMSGICYFVQLRSLGFRFVQHSSSICGAWQRAHVSCRHCPACGRSCLHVLSVSIGILGVWILGRCRLECDPVLKVSRFELRVCLWAFVSWSFVRLGFVRSLRCCNTTERVSICSVADSRWVWPSCWCVVLNAQTWLQTTFNILIISARIA